MAMWQVQGISGVSQIPGAALQFIVCGCELWSHRSRRRVDFVLCLPRKFYVDPTECEADDSRSQ